MSLRQRLKVWWCKRFHDYAGFWWGQLDNGSATYCCKCGRMLQFFPKFIPREKP